jgi:Bacterial Ig domain
MVKHFTRAAALLFALALTACTTGNESGLPLPGFGDTLDPTIAVAGVTEGATVSGTVAISAAATDNVGVTAFTLSIDGTQVASAANGALAYSWVTTGATNAAHTLVFNASDANGNTATTTLQATVNNAGGGGGGDNTGTVSGTVFAPNGIDPVNGALVFIQDNGVSAVGDPPGEPYEVFTYSGANGQFTLDNVPTGLQSLKILKGAFFKVFNITVNQGNNPLPASETTLPSTAEGGAGDMLVVTGNYDHIENVLAKLGLAELNDFHLIELGTETFEMVDGNSSLDDGTYQNFDQWWPVATNWDNYRTIFLNCGNDFDAAFLADTVAVAKLKAWVQAGGHLYCTDWSYNFIEQVWPEKVDFDDFLGSGDGLSTTPEGLNDAKTGDSITSLALHIEDSGLASWMGGLGASTAGDMFNTIDWLGAWVPMDAVAATGVKVWATGTPPGDASRPMTVTFSDGAGTVLFSSYHTEETPSADLTPQERVLQYLIFEVL